jgi:lipid-A-disaccharide synthase
MKAKSIMLIAGEPSGDVLGAELVRALRECLREVEPALSSDAQPLHAGMAPRFFGAGGPRMASAGVEMILDMTRHSIIGIVGVIKGYAGFRRRFRQLYRLALTQQPDAIVCVDFAGFNRRFAAAIASHIRSRSGWFHDWRPKLIQYVSPQVWASREGRAFQIERDYDLLLSIFPFEKSWYAGKTPRLPVVYVGNPIVDRASGSGGTQPSRPTDDTQVVLLLPGSRKAELARHLPVMIGAIRMLKARVSRLRTIMVLPDENLVAQAKSAGLPPEIDLRLGRLEEALGQATVAIASTGTVTMECAAAGVPVVALYKTSWAEYQIGRQIVNVKYLAMPNILAGAPLFPEFIQDAAAPGNIAAATLDLLGDESRREHIREGMARVISSLGPPGASRRAAQAITALMSKTSS